MKRVPPNDLTAEKSVLGSILLDCDCLDAVCDTLTAENFYSDAHRIIFKRMIEMQKRGIREIDTTTIANELKKENQLEEIGGPAYLIELLETVQHVTHIDYYSKIVREKSLQRELIYRSDEIIDVAHRGNQNPEEMLSEAESLILTACNGYRDKNDSVGINRALGDAWDAITSRKENGKQNGLTTGFIDLDEITNGFQPSELIVIAARPSIGKTAIAMNHGLRIAETSKKGVLIFSLEQSARELTERLICIQAKSNNQRMKKGQLDEIETYAITKAMNELNELNILIDDRADRTLTQIASKVRRLKKQEGIGCVIIDYLQLIRAEDRRIPREQQVADMSRQLKCLARGEDIPVIILAQLNRSVEQREDKRPRLSDLRESGAIEQDADVVMFLHRPEVYDKNKRPGEADVIVAKNRSGPTGTATLTFKKESFRFEDYKQDFQNYAFAR